MVPVVSALTIAWAGRSAAAEPAASSPDPNPKPSCELVWNEAWPRFRPIEYAATGVVAASWATLVLTLGSPEDARWRGGIFFDDAARDGLRASSPEGRDRARLASDFTAVAAIAQVALLDSVILPGAYGQWDLAWQLTLMNTEAFALGALATRGALLVVRRARPSTEDCERDFDFDPLCGAGTNASFPSGHSSTAFVAAGLSCAHHANLPLYGGGAGDAIGCGVTLALAGSTAMLRVIGDRHYVTDVVAGSTLGFGIGFGLPLLLHYRPLAPRVSLADGALDLAVLPALNVGTTGFDVVGRF